MEKQKIRFEYDITDYCNLNCAGCSHYAPIGERTYVSKNQADKELKVFANIIKDDCDIIHLMGGEPLLNPEIIEILKVSREYFPNTQLQIVSNGILLDKMSVLFWKTCHDLDIKICLTLYPVKINMNKILALAEAFKVDVVPFRNGMHFNRFLLDENCNQNVNSSYQQCNLKKCLLYKDCKLYPCTISACIYKLNNYFNKNFNVTNDDFIQINTHTSKNDIYNFLNKPIHFCSYCMVEKWNDKYEWSISEKNINEWVYEE